MEPAAKRTFWIGLFIIYVDFSVSALPLLPDVLGYILLAWALGQFAIYSSAFTWARRCAIALAGLEVLQFLSQRMADPLFISAHDPWHQVKTRIAVVPLLLSVGLMWWISSGFIDCLLRLDDARAARRLGFVRTLSASVALLIAAGTLWQPAGSWRDAHIEAFGVVVGASVVAALIVGVAEIWLWSVALRRMPDTLYPVPERPALAPHIVKRMTQGGLLLLAGAIVAGLLSRPPQAPRLLQLSGGTGIGGYGSRAAWSPDGTRLAVGGLGMQARIYDPTTGAVIVKMPERAEFTLHDLAWSPDGKKLLSVGSDIYIDDSRTGAELTCISPCMAHPRRHGHVDSADWSPDGDTLALLWYALDLFDTRTLTYTNFISTKTLTESDAVNVEYAPDSSMFATVGQSAQARIWSRDGELQREFIHPDGNIVSDIAWSPDGSLLAAAADYNVVQVWDVSTGEAVQTILLTTTFDRWLWRRPHHNIRDWAMSVAWSPDGRFLAAGSSDASAGVWELASGDQVLTLNGQTDAIADISFSPDGQRIVTASHDRTVWLWDSTALYR